MLIEKEALLKKAITIVDEFEWDNHVIAYDDVLNAPAVEAVVLPCKIGDVVWTIRHFHSKKCVQQGIVSEMFFTKDMELEIVVKHIARGKWGEKVFATYEDALKASGENHDS